MLDGYCRALAGECVTVAPSSQLVAKHLGWSRSHLPTTDGVTVFLPDTLVLPPPTAAEPIDGFTWYKVMATHQVGHLEWGSFGFDYSRAYGVVSLAATEPALTHYSRYFARFELPQLARDLFAIAEGLRIDACVLRRYAGLEPAYRSVQAQCLAMRSPRAGAERLELRVEQVLRVSLGERGGELQRQLGDAAARDVRALLARVELAGARVEDAALAAEALYTAVLARLVPRDGDDYRSPAEVLYRGVFKPELGQLLGFELDSHDVQPPEVASDLERRTELIDLAQRSPEVELAASEVPSEQLARSVAENLEDESAERGPPPDGSDDASDTGAASDADSALEATEPGSFAYDEWDAGASRFRTRHCVLRERLLPPIAGGFYRDTLARNAVIAQRLRQQLAAIAARPMLKGHPMADGEELDLDACVDAVVDMRSGRTPSDKLFRRRDVRERDVAVAFLLDMSSSTGDPIELGADRHAPGVRRLIDVEKDALVVLTHALAELGDRYGIYGFSGYGRKAVELFVIKELHESLSEEVKHRIAAIEPQSGTRMGAAIRHVTAKLRATRAKTRFLFLLSDGRPRDQGYGNHGASQQYAVEDTRMALLEAQRLGITPFCLAVDKSGHDYLGAMMRDMRYEVLWDAAMLPERMTQLYRALST